MISPIISLMLQCLLFPKLCSHICPSLQQRQRVYTLCTCTYICEKGVASRLWSQRKCCPGNCVGTGHWKILGRCAAISNSESFMSTHSTRTWGSSFSIVLHPFPVLFSQILSGSSLLFNLGTHAISFYTITKPSTVWERRNQNGLMFRWMYHRGHPGSASLHHLLC